MQPVGETNIDIRVLVASNGINLLKLKIGQVVRTILSNEAPG